MPKARPSDMIKGERGGPPLQDPRQSADEMVQEVSNGATDEPEEDELSEERKEQLSRIDTSNTGSYIHELKKLRGRHHLIIRLAATGKVNQKEIAQIVGVSEKTVSNTLNSSLGKQKLKKLQSQAYEQTVDMLKELEALAQIGVAEIEDALVNNTVDKETRVDIAQDLLDRTGFGKTKNLNVKREQVTDDDIKEIKREAKKKAEEAGVVEDANVVSETPSDDSDRH